MVMKVLVVGGGGREHAIAKALSRNEACEIYSVMPKKNPGIAKLCKDFHICKDTDKETIAGFALKAGVEYAVIGPEAPLEAGVVDYLEDRGIACVGPSRIAARLETDKAFCREMMEKYGVAGCPKYRVFHDAKDAARFILDNDGDLAIKPIGLTGGKGVKIMGEHFGREGAIEYVNEIGGNVVLEERLIGEEFTLMAFVDGTHLVPMPLVQDHKRAYDGDVGPNTGGMGSYTMPDHMLPFVLKTDYDKALSIMKDVVAFMNKAGTPYRGVLYGQFMNTSDGPKVIEFNARFGDPEAMNLLTLLKSDFCEIVKRIVDGTLSASHVEFEKKASVCKYIVPKGYPDSPKADEEISTGNIGDAHLYYANVSERNDKLYTQTSRTLAFVGMADTLLEAESIAESASSSVKGSVFYRRDIGTEEVLKKRISHMKELR
jgi:phosphoribosylamine--glycine ligase